VNPHPASSDHNDQSVYFFVSYAHVPPVEGVPAEQPDPRVKDFFTRLSGRVSHYARSDSPLGQGLCDQSFDFGPDWQTALSQALGSAEVLVPLYSSRYLAPESWPLAERASFEERLQAAGDPAGHIQPVLWMPLAPGEKLPSDGVDSLAADVPLYGKLGLGALSELDMFQTVYDDVVDRLAERIVRVAEDSPIGPSASPTTPRGADRPADLVIAVLAPTTTSLPDGRSAASYGARPSDWAPFAQARPLPIAQAAAAIAERLNLRAEIVDLPGGESMTQGRPVALLIDPWILARPDGERLLRRATETLPDWALPIVVSDSEDPSSGQRGAALHDEAVAKLSGVLPSQRDIHDTESFMNLVPSVVAQARRRFLNRLPRTGRRRPVLNRRSQPPPPEETGNHD
jgi:FxsC-like protein